MIPWAHQGVWFLTVASIELCVLAAIVWMATTVGSRWRSSTTQFLWTAVVAKPALVIIAAVVGVHLLPATDITSQSILRGLAGSGLGALDPDGTLATTPWLAPVLLAIWAIGFIATIVALTGGMIGSWGQIRRARLAGIHLSPRFVRHLGIKPPADVDIIVTDVVRSPGSYGLWNAAVLIPTDWLPLQRNGTLGPDDAVALRHILQHELGHVRRRDGVRQLLIKLAASPFWFHPAAHFAVRRWLYAVEIAVDAGVLCDSRNDSTQYARTLLSALRRSVPHRATAGLWFLGSARRAAVRELHRRLQSVLTPHTRLGWASHVASTVCVVAIVTSFPITVTSIHPPIERIAASPVAAALHRTTYATQQVGDTQLARRRSQPITASIGRYSTSLMREGRARIVSLDPAFLWTDWSALSNSAASADSQMFADNGSRGPARGTQDALATDRQQTPVSQP
ncbi:MAG: M56 family metallopeptidase [Phycisphaerales bacterium]|nr:M56 family metallopeptidase [Phycisphaerales bacterium]